MGAGLLDDRHRADHEKAAQIAVALFGNACEPNLALAQRYNGYNNGEISMSVREAARLLHVAKDTATKAFRELEAKGFIRRNICGSFNWKIRHATTWILTEHAFGDQLATKEFARWQPENLKAGPNPETRCPRIGTVSKRIHAIRLLGVLDLGPSPLFCTSPRSQSTPHI
jgi:hypothetical protein